MPEPHLPVGVAAVGQALDGDVEEGAAQDGQLLPSLEPAAVAVDLGMDIVPCLGPDGAVERAIRQDQGLVRLGAGGSGFLRPLAPRAFCGGFQFCLLLGSGPPARGGRAGRSCRPR